VNNLVTACLIGFALVTPSATAKAQTQLTGKTGYLSEWQFSIALTNSASGEFSSPVTWQHTGLCTVNGPAEKHGDIDIQIRHMGPWARLRASISFEQLRCTYSGSYSETVTGFMQCTDKTSLPLTLLFK
jgi:hypothetical protein